ncbi:MAG: multiheme c-type cytochrome [Actinomycetota bacterium]
MAPGEWRARRTDVRVAPEAVDAGGRPRAPKRLRKTWERPLPWTIVGVVGFVGAVALGYVLIESIQNGGGASGRGAFWLITALGILAVALSVATFLYTFRKRSRRLQEGSKATMMTWFKSHIWLGLLAFGVVIAHVLVRPVTFDLSTGKLALIAFFVLVLSGILWRLVYRRIPGQVARGPRNLAVVDTKQRLEGTQVQIDKLSAGKSPQFQALVQARLRGEPPSALDPQAATLPDHERATWVEVNTLAYNRLGLAKREERQRHYARWLQRWKLVHIPLAAIFLGLVVVHVLDVFGAGRAAFGGKTAQFPSSQSCAGCHSEVAEEWRGSVMAHGITSPFMVAQTALAVRQNRNDGHVLGQLCVNCHGPIGATITGSDTLPFPGTANSTDPGATGKRNLIMAEGVSCVVCHALGDAPGRATGADPFLPNKSGLSSLGDFHGPRQSNPPPIPVPDHQITQGGYMTNQLASSQLCGACHIVEVDLSNNGKPVDRFADPQPDLVLQTTFDEWSDEYLSTFGDNPGAAQGCVGCHTSPETAKLVSRGPFGSAAPERAVRSHTFFGVDYDLAPGHPGLSDQQFQRELAETEGLLKSAATMRVRAKVSKQDGGSIAADVLVTDVGNGHQLPTGFAFVRQMWLEIKAETVDADGNATGPVCLADAPAGTGTLAARCSSGTVTATQDLPYCDPSVIAADTKRFGGFVSADAQIHLAPGAASPPGKCDPWLASWQKILTDGPAPRKGQIRHEVAYQSKLADIVRTRHRVFDNLAMAPMGPPGFKGRPDPKDRTKFLIQPDRFPAPPSDGIRYDFRLTDANGNRLTPGTQVKITATLNFRHLPPYFIRSLANFYPPGVTAQGLISNLRIVDMTSATTTITINR